MRKPRPLSIVLVLAALALCLADARAVERPGPQASPGIYTEPQLIELLKKIYDWPAFEKLVFITVDGQYFIFGGGEPNEVTIKFRDLIRTLARKGQSLKTVTNIVHNHKREFVDFSPADLILYEQLRKLGFTGKFQIFYPQTDKIKTLERRRR
jgi:hypothetical protein